jgi:GTP-binding protein HflX
MTYSTADETMRGFLVGLERRGAPGALNVEDSLSELALLADTAEIQTVGQVWQRVNSPDPATFIGSGKVEEIVHWIEELNVNVVIFDDELSPRHQRELEEAFGEDVTVIDRTALILDIFAQHAHTREGALQVALAQYEYRLPRLTRQWTHLARQVGGGASRGGPGGVGLRGPGETQLETDRREIRRRISHLKEELESIRAHRERHRDQRRRAGIPVVSLVGYTNAGKSTLLNRLSESDVYVADQLFATLDPTTRRVTLPEGRETLLTDTVGFIQKLPHSLVAAFRATLEEILEADVLVHVADASHPNVAEHIQVVNDVLANDIGVRDIPTMLVMNKLDALEADEPDRLAALRNRFPGSLFISALEGEGIEPLLRRIESMLKEQEAHVRVRIPYAEGAALAKFYEVASIEDEQHTEAYTELVGWLDREHVGQFAEYLVEDGGSGDREA